MSVYGSAHLDEMTEKHFEGIRLSVNQAIGRGRR